MSCIAGNGRGRVDAWHGAIGLLLPERRASEQEHCRNNCGVNLSHAMDSLLTIELLADSIEAGILAALAGSHFSTGGKICGDDFLALSPSGLFERNCANGGEPHKLAATAQLGTVKIYSGMNKFPSNPVRRDAQSAPPCCAPVWQGTRSGEGWGTAGEGKRESGRRRKRNALRNEGG